MVDFENRSGAYFWVREHRKRRKPPFAGRPHLNISRPRLGGVAVVFRRRQDGERGEFSLCRLGKQHALFHRRRFEEREAIEDARPVRRAVRGLGLPIFG